MSFKPQGASLPSRFQKSNQNSSFKQRPRDRLCTIDGFDVAQKMVHATEVDTGRKIKARINPDKKIATGTRTAADKWNGNIIDERMEKQLEAGSRVVLEACETEKKIKNGTEEVSLMRCNWIASVPDNAPEKSFTGIFTVSSFNNRVVATQVWDKTAIDPSTTEGEAAIDALGDRLNDIFAQDRAKTHPITMGVQFRTLVATGEKDGKPTYEMVDSSPPFDWLRAEKAADGSEIRPGQPLDKASLEGFLTGYMDYVYGSADPNAEDAEPGLVARGVIAEDAKIIVEVMPYRVFQTSKLNESFELTNEKAPLYRLANVVTKYGQQDDSGYSGKNWAVDGIVIVTADQAPKNKGDEWVARNLVTRLFTNGFTGNVHSLVLAADGGRVRPHPSLDRERTNDAPAPGAAGQAQGTTAATGVTPALTAVTPAYGDDDDAAGGENFFAQALAVSVPAEDPTPAPAAEQAPAAAEQAPAAAPAATPAGGANRFRRGAV